MNYYQQDGIHSPVTGGRGTEELENFAPSITVNIPIDSSRTLNLDGGVDFYSSASSDNIDNPYNDPGHISGASARDERTYVNAKYTIKNAQWEYGFLLGSSFEWDVFSYSGGISLGLNSEDNNRGVQFTAKYFYDDWKLIYPIEFRNGQNEFLDTDIRHSINSSIVFNANISRKLSASIAADYIVQSGLLSTPFHRVYFQGATDATIEMLPDNRQKYPFGLRVNYHINETFILRTFFRYYADSWGLTGNTAEITVPIKISQTFRIYPFYRYHDQGAADYFAPFQVHTGIEEFYTSDFDLSTFESHKYGLGISYAPLYGLGRFKYSKDKVALIKSLDLRVTQYDRSDGLTATMGTLGFQINFKR
ncbi:MAG: DUF3570 domain-containing protein [Bacteroidota bacterium]